MQTVRSEKFLNMALRYARKGIHVFPCSPENKRPLIKHGLKSASTDPERIRDWWRRWPSAMIGAATGEISGFWAVDLDVTADADGRETWRALAAAQGGVPETRTLTTPSGGVHLYFKWPTPDALAGRALRNSAKTRLGAGIDTRGDGGYVILPPSQRADGRVYRWGDFQTYRSVAPAPAWLLDLACKPVERAAAPKLSEQAAPRRPAGNVRPIDGGASARYAARAIENEATDLARTMPGARGSALNTAAFNLGQLVGAGMLARDLVESELFRASELNGLVATDGAQRVYETINRGIEAGIAQPRGPRRRAA